MNWLIGKTDYEVSINERISESFQGYLEEALKKVMDTISQKGELYDTEQCIIPRMAFGLASWVQSIYCCANRLVGICISAIRGVQPNEEKVIDLLIDAAGYSLMALAWLLMKSAEATKGK